MRLSSHKARLLDILWRTLKNCGTCGIVLRVIDFAVVKFVPDHLPLNIRNVYVFVRVVRRRGERGPGKAWHGIPRSGPNPALQSKPSNVSGSIWTVESGRCIRIENMDAPVTVWTMWSKTNFKINVRTHKSLSYSLGVTSLLSIQK